MQKQLDSLQKEVVSLKKELKQQQQKPNYKKEQPRGRKEEKSRPTSSHRSRSPLRSKSGEKSHQKDGHRPPAQGHRVCGESRGRQHGAPAGQGQVHEVEGPDKNLLQEEVDP